jgi:hypothetical protein
MKKFLVLITCIFMAGIILTGCVSPIQPAVDEYPAVESVAPAAVEESAEPVALQPGEWTIEIDGLSSASLSGGELVTESGQPAHMQTIEVEVKGEQRTYSGISLDRVVSRADGEEEEHPFTFDQEAWNSGYEITATAADGYSATFLSSDYDPRQILIAYLKNGENIDPLLVGTELTKDLWIKNIASLELNMGETETVIPTLSVVGGGADIIFSTNELKLTPYYIEEFGGYTTSAGTYFESLYGGVRLYDLLNSFGELPDDGSVTVVSTDGYEMSYAVSELKDTTEGIWIAAFEENGDQMVLDPGYFRIVKVGNPIPNIDGHSSAKMVGEIQFTATPLRDFNLRVIGKKDSIVDRATMQSGINCTAHNTDVEYYNKKSGEVETYSGMPLFLLLAYADDPDFAPHKQTDRSITAYDSQAAESGYKIKLSAVDGYSITLDSRELNGNLDVIVAMYQNDEELSAADWPLKLVWDQNADIVPEGIKAIRQLAQIELLFD